MVQKIDSQKESETDLKSNSKTSLETDLKTSSLEKALAPSPWPEDKKIIQSIPTAKRRLLAVIGLPLSWFFSHHYLAAPRGFYQALFWPVFLALAFWFFKDTIQKKDGLMFVSLGAAISGSIHSALYASDPLSFINFLALPILSVFTLLLATQSYERLTLRPFLSTLDSLLIGPFRSLRFIPAFLKDSSSLKKEAKSHQLLKEVSIGLLITLPLLYLLINLLSSSDVAFQASLNELMDRFLNNLQLTNTLWRIVTSLIALVYFLGVLLSIRLSKTDRPISVPSTQHSPVISLIILGSVDLLYALFTVTQLQSLYFPKTQLTAMNQSISQYARSGFFSLLVVMAINLFLLWYLSSFTQMNKQFDSAMKLGYLLMFLFTANMIASSFYKMALYESEFGYTHLRLFVKFALVFFAFALLILIPFVLHRIQDILKPLTLLALSLYIVLNFINLDGIIVQRSHEIYATHGRLDIDYLSNLSADAYSNFEKSFNFEKSTDPQVIELKNQYLSNLYHHFYEPQLQDHPLAQTLTELRIKP